MTKAGTMILGAALLTALSVSGTAMAEAWRPNIVLMIADDMSWKDWGSYGNTIARTPNIDKSARIIVSNAGTDGHVVVDGIEVLAESEIAD